MILTPLVMLISRKIVIVYTLWNKSSHNNSMFYIITTTTPCSIYEIEGKNFTQRCLHHGFYLPTEGMLPGE